MITNLSESYYLGLLAKLCTTSANAEWVDLVQQIKRAEPDQSLLFNLAVEHGVTGLMYSSFAEINTLELNQFFEQINSFNQHKIIATKFLDSEAKKLLNLFVEENIPFVVLKGFALAHSIYPTPESRTKSDIDIFIDTKYYEQAKQVFSQQGYKNPRGWEPTAISNEFSMSKRIGEGMHVLFDVHTKISNSKVIQNLITFEELSSSADTASLPDINLINTPYALVHAIVHMLHHRAMGDKIKLIWYYDIYLLVERFTPVELKQTKQLIILKELVSVFSVGIDLTLGYFDSEKLRELQTWCKQPEIQAHSENKYNVLLSSMSGVNGMLITLNNTPGFRNKWRLIQEIALPPKAEIYNKYGTQTNQPLFWLYFRRIAGGIVKALRAG
ncbi:nucleotidyltransferase family protein [uncultured Paraglaciecola sp.]|uniref:nucleotidyltransferase family protein n=1 Tax=uncultured Paraglaciecola sp. TaxID=1765024 RepID=UPI0030DB78A1